jgi:DNA-binding MarR family transcriptional regulator
VNALEGKGLLRRRPNPEDSRSALLKLTAAGRRMYEVILPLLQARQQEVVAPLSAREQEVLVALFDKLIDRKESRALTY